MRVTQDVLLLLEECACAGERLSLPGQLDRPAYVAVNKVLVAAGGKWNRKTQAHVFPFPAEDVIDQIILTGQITTPQEMGYFPTPPAVVASLFAEADLGPGMKVLEPSAGEGAIAGPASAIVGASGAVDCVEIDARHARAIGAAGYAQHLTVCDFLEVEPGGLPRYDRVVMNPPFAKQADIAHVTHALRFLRPGGLLVSVMATGVTFRQNKAAKDFRAAMDLAGGRFVSVPDGSFKVSGTGISVIIAVIPGVRQLGGSSHEDLRLLPPPSPHPVQGAPVPVLRRLPADRVGVQRRRTARLGRAGAVLRPPRRGVCHHPEAEAEGCAGYAG